MPDSMRLAAALTLLILLAVSMEVAAGADYVLKPVLKPIELTDRTPLILDEERRESLGGTYRIYLKGKGNPLYGKGLFLLPNETGVVDFRFEILQAPSGYKLWVERVWMNPRWCDVHLELAAEGYTQPIRERALIFNPEEYASREEPLSIRLLIKPYAFKELLPHGWVEECFVDMEISGNVSFGANAREEKWSMGFTVYVLKPEDELEVEIERPFLAFEVGQRREPWGTLEYVSKIILRTGFDIRNNLDGDLVLEKARVDFVFGSRPPGVEKWSNELKLDRILRPGQAETIRMDEEWGTYFHKEVFEDWQNGTMIITLHYFTERGEGIKRFLYAFDLSEAEKISPQATATKSTAAMIPKNQSRTQTIISTSRIISTRTTSRPRPGVLPIPVGDLGRIFFNPVTILLVLGIVLVVACIVAKRGGKAGRGASEVEGGPRPPPLPPPTLSPPPEPSPPSMRRVQTTMPKPSRQKVVPRWVYGECLKIMEEKYREFRRLRESGELRYALYALHDGLEAAMKQYAKDVGAITAEAERRMTLGDVLKILLNQGLISDLECELIKRVSKIRNKYKHKVLTVEPTREEVNQASGAYQIIVKEFRKRYEPLPK